MAQNKTQYASGGDSDGYYKVTFLVNETGKTLTRSFESAYLAKVFANKVKHGGNCTLISCPLFA